MEVLTPFQTNYEGKLLVCFESTVEADAYELGIETTSTLVSMSLDAPIAYEDGQKCALSSSKVALGAYVNLWAVVVGYDSAGNIVETGEAEEREICEYSFYVV